MSIFRDLIALIWGSDEANEEPEIVDYYYSTIKMSIKLLSENGSSLHSEASAYGYAKSVEEAEFEARQSARARQKQISQEGFGIGDTWFPASRILSVSLEKAETKLATKRRKE